MRYENGVERISKLQPPKKTEAITRDIIQRIFASNCNQAKILNNHSNFNDNGYRANTSDENGKMSMNCVKSHFVEIGEFNCGSMFGLGEHMDDRAIVARHTEVQCLLIPHYWLFQKKQNAGNIWQR